MTGSMSKVGNRFIYEAGDQRTVSQSEIEQAKKDNTFHEGKENSHKANDSKDDRSIANRLGHEQKRDNKADNKVEEFEAAKRDPTAPAKMHGNEPSKGAKIDAELQQEEQEELRRKGKLN